jgi:hypothetical protein
MHLVHPNEFIVDIPDLHPASNDYISFWRDMKRKCIEGIWVSGRYMPANLAFYTNLAHIQLSKTGTNLKSFARPFLQDLEWKLFAYYTACKGFSGFELSEDTSSNYALLDPSLTDEDLFYTYPSTLRIDGTRKIFVHPYDALLEQYPANLGKPLYHNQAWNALIAGSRDSGKSYAVGVGMALKEWLFDGALEYNEESINNPSRVDITIGAEESSRSGLMFTKIRQCLEALPGSRIVKGDLVPSPVYKQYQGSWTVGKQIEAIYDKKYATGWQEAGSKSVIKHRSFKDNSFADQGARNLLIILEEAGMFSNLKEVFMNTKDNLRDGDRKIGSLIMLGTGGDMGAGTTDLKDMFYHPDAYEILSLPDEWENKGKVGFFIPAYMALRRFKDEYGNTLVDKAKAYWESEREKTKFTASSVELSKLMQYRPNKPTEMFLASTSSIFPTLELQERFGELMDTKQYSLNHRKVELFFSKSSLYNGVDYELDHNLMAINEYPWKPESKEGCAVVYELPYLDDAQQKTPEGAYIIGCDPFRDNTNSGESFAAIYVIKTNKYPTSVGHNQIVASYISRPFMGTSQVNETLYKLSLFYGNAKIYFENAVGNVKDYFEKVKRLDLLALQPTTLFNRKASFNTGQPLIYGYPMSNEKIKWEALQYVRNWLLETREVTETKVTRNLDLLPDPFLIQQLIHFNMEGNFDAVMGFIGCVVGLEEIYNKQRTPEQMERYSEMDREFLKTIVNNKKLFSTT